MGASLSKLGEPARTGLRNAGAVCALFLALRLLRLFSKKRKPRVEHAEHGTGSPKSTVAGNIDMRPALSIWNEMARTSGAALLMPLVYGALKSRVGGTCSHVAGKEFCRDRMRTRPTLRTHPTHP